MADCGCDGDLLCFKHKLRSIQFNPAPAPQTLMERRWQRDMPAYKRLRDSGLQPKAIDGSADLETRASTQIEVEMGHIFRPDEMPKVREGMEAAREMREFVADNGIPAA